MTKKIIKVLFWILVIVVLGGFSGVMADRMVLPWLSSFEKLSKIEFFKKINEKVTVITKTEQLVVREDFTVTKIAQKVAPAVVSIVSYDKESENGLGQGRLLTNRDISENMKTGIVLTSDGLVLSVMKKGEAENGAEALRSHKVLLADGRELDAKLIGADPYSMTEFYKIDVSNFSVPQLGNSDELETGEKLVLCGSGGMDRQNSYSTGVIVKKDPGFSLLNSELASSEKMEGAIITDAFIDRSNIGGPAVDFNGTVVGIVNEVEKNGKNEGMLIPINKLSETIERVIREGKIERGSLGLYYLSIDREIALLNGLGRNEGALVYSFSGQQGLAVVKNSAADEAKIQINDIITAVNDQQVSISRPLSALISKYRPGDKISLKIERNGKNLELEVLLK